MDRRQFGKLALSAGAATTGAGEAGPLAAVKNEIARLQEKADLVLLPLWQGLGDTAQKMKDLPQELAQETMARLMALETDDALPRIPALARICGTHRYGAYDGLANNG